MEKPNFESGPEKEGTIEEKIARAFKEFAFSDDAEEGLRVFQENYLSKELPGASVTKIYKGPEYTNSDVYFVDRLEDSPGSPDVYFKVNVEGKDYLLPESVNKGKFGRLKYGYLKTQGELFFDVNDIRPAPLIIDGNGRLVTDIPEEKEKEQ